MPTPSRSSRTPQQATRGSWARTNADLTVNEPDGFPSEYPPVWWVGSDQLNLNASWNYGGWNDPLGSGSYGPALAVVNRATSLVVDPIAQSPLKVQELGFGGRPLGTPRWLTDPMLTRPDSRFTNHVASAVLRLPRSKFWGDFLRSALWWGIGAFVTEEDEQGQPLAGTLKLINPHTISTERASDGSLRWVVGSGEDRAVFDRDGYIQLGPVRYRLVVLRNPASEVSTEGLSQGVFAMSPQTYGLANQIETYASGTFRSGVPSGYLSILTPGATKEMADDLRASWMRHHGGDRRSIAVLSSTVSFTPISLSPVDAALGEMTRLSIASVAFSFGIDPNMLGAGLQNSASYANVRDYFRQHRDLGIGIWITALEDVLTALLPGTQGVKVDTDAFTRPEAAERYAAYQVALDAGILTLDEVRAMEGLDPMPSSQSEPEPAPTPALAPVPDQQTEPRTARVQAWRTR